MISAIAAIGRNRELGKNGDLIWRISDDLKRVKELTTGHPIIMGSKTHESIGHPLPNRTNIVISRDASYSAESCVVAHSLEEALSIAAQSEGSDEIFIFGGAQIYSLAFPYIEKLYLTVIDAKDPSADTFFPLYEDFKVLDIEKRDQDGLSYEWQTLAK